MAAKVIANAKSVKGLALTKPERAAYNKAFAAAATLKRNRLAKAAAAQGLRKYRLGAAHAAIKKASAARANAQRAAVAAFATQMSWRQSKLAHQNSALQARIEQDMSKHVLLAGRLQYIHGGEKAYAHKAVMRTLTTAQALSVESRVHRKIHKVATKAAKSTLPKSKLSTAAAKSVAKVNTAASKAITQAGTAAGLAAAAAVAPAVPAKGRTCAMPSWQLGSFAVTATGYDTPDSRQSWLGDVSTPNCVVIAIANNLLLQCSHRADERLVKELTSECGDNPSIEDVLWYIYRTGWPYHPKIRLGNYEAVEPQDAERAGLVIGFEVTTDNGPGDHAALTLDDGEVVSWGSVMLREALIEEAWELTWKRWLRTR